MKMRIRSCCCCDLSTVLTAVIAVQTVAWLVLTISAVILVVCTDYQTVTVAAWIGLSPLRLSVIALGLSFSGLLSNMVLLVGLRTQLPYLLLPWLVINSLFILAMFAAGSYLLIFFTMAKTEQDFVLAGLSATLILLSMFMVFVIVLVIKMFIEMKQKQLLVRVASSFRGSRSSLNYRHKSAQGTPKSIKSMRSIHSSDGYEDKIMNGMLRRYKMGSRNLSEVQSLDKSCSGLTSHRNLNAQEYQPQRLPSKLSHPIYKSRSLEYILDSSTDESLYQEQYTKSLPRRPRRQQNDHHASYKNTDTMRSCKSISSGKSVGIHPRVTEYHYDHAREVVAAHNDGERVIEDSKTSDCSGASVPPPIFPKPKKLAGDHSIHLYQDFVL